MDNDIFTLIGRDEEKVKLWQDLGEARGELLCKGHDDALCKLKVTFYNEKTQSLECSFDSSTQLKNGEEYLGHFFLGGEKYYFKSLARISQDKVVVPIPKELYHLQRRQSYRVHVPEAYPAFFNIITLNGFQQSLIGNLADLSSQGCRASYRANTDLLRLGDKITGLLILDRRAPLEVQGVIRHIKPDEGGKPTVTLGIEFTPLPVVLENKLFALTMEIHKELFRRPV